MRCFFVRFSGIAFNNQYIISTFVFPQSVDNPVEKRTE